MIGVLEQSHSTIRLVERGRLPSPLNVGHDLHGWQRERFLQFGFGSAKGVSHGCSCEKEAEAAPSSLHYAIFIASVPGADAEHRISRNKAAQTTLILISNFMLLSVILKSIFALLNVILKSIF